MTNAKIIYFLIYRNYIEIFFANTIRPKNPQAKQKLQTNRLEFECGNFTFLGHRKQVRKAHDGTEVQQSRDKGQNGTFRYLKWVHFFHTDLDFGLKNDRDGRLYTFSQSRDG